MIINPEETAADEIARVLRFPTAIQIDTFAKGRVEILKFRIPQESVLDKMAIADLRVKLNCDVLVCGVERGEDAFIPGGNFVLKSGDLISIVAAPQNAAYFFKKIGIKTNRVKDTIIVGGGATGYYLAKKLLQTGKNITAEHNVKFVRAKKNSYGSEIETMHVILDGKAEALEFHIQEGSPVANTAIEELPLKENVLIACINRDGTILTPRGKDVILPGDTVIVITTNTGAQDFDDILRKK